MSLASHQTEPPTLLRRAKRCGSLVAVLLVASATFPAYGQGYATDEINSSLSPKGTLARRYAKSGDGDGELFKQYVEEYFFPSMTVTTAEGLANLQGSRQDLFKSYLQGATPENRQYMDEQARQFAIKVLRSRQYHPAVRYNALLILGGLNDDYATGKPSAEANRLLCALADRGATSDRALGYEVAGALVGLERHAAAFAKLGPDEQKRTQKTLYALISTEELPFNVEPAVSDWIYATTASAIGNLGTPGPRGVFATKIAAKLVDPDLSLETRASMAAQFEKMGMTAANVSAEPLVKGITTLAGQIAQQEAEIATKFEELQFGGAARVVPGGRDKLGRRIRAGDRERGAKYVREGVLDELVDLRKGVRAVKGVVAADAQPRFDKIDKALSDAIRSVSEESGDLQAAADVKKMAQLVQEAVRPDPAADLAAGE